MWNGKAAAETDNGIRNSNSPMVETKCLAKYVCKTIGLYSYVPIACYRQYLQRPLGHSVMQFKYQLMVC
jgi:hypothetical protein